MLASGEPVRWSATHPLPNASAAVQPAPGTRLEFMPLDRHYRIDINTIPPKIDERQWRLKISGLVEKPLSLTMEDLKRYDPLHQFITLSCISNPVGGDLIGTQRWTGVSLQRLLLDWRLKPGATHLKMRSADQFLRCFSWRDQSRPADHADLCVGRRSAPAAARLSPQNRYPRDEAAQMDRIH